MNLAQAIIESRPKAFDGIMPRWATVTSTNPLRIRFDGESNPLSLKPVDLVGVNINDRVWCQLYAGQVFIIGINGGPPEPPTKALGIMYKTDGFQASSATEAPVILNHADAILRGGMTTVADDGGSFVIPRTGLYRVTARAYVVGAATGSYLFTPWRLAGSTWYQIGITRLEHLSPAGDDATSSTTYTSLNAGDKVSLWFIGQGASTWGNADKKGAALTVEEV